MTKVDIAERIQAGTGFSKKESADMLEAAFSLMKKTLEQGTDTEDFRVRSIYSQKEERPART